MAIITGGNGGLGLAMARGLARAGAAIAIAARQEKKGQAAAEELNAAGTSLVFAELKDPVREKLERYQLIGPLNPAHFFPTLDAALETFREQTGAAWTPAASTSASLE